MGASSQHLPPRAAMSGHKSIRLLIAEDTLMGCEMLISTLQHSQAGVGKFVSAITFGQIAEAAKDVQIDVALINEHIENGERSGLEIIDYLRENCPAVRSILLTQTLTADLIITAFGNGAKGIFCRTEPIRILARCIRAVHQGQIWANSEQLELILHNLVATRPKRFTIPRASSTLTKREEQVASLVAEGLTNREVAKRLGLSQHTVGNYLFKCYEKLGLSSRVEFVLHTLNKRRPPHEIESASGTSAAADRFQTKSYSHSPLQKVRDKDSI
jgi:two-component system nitrate/nitrite response regulator NarL